MTSNNTQQASGNSRSITSNQIGIHPSLEKVVEKHLSATFKKPFQQHNIESYKRAIQQAGQSRIILDSGCGNGNSTRLLAQQYPEYFVIGVDKSAARLNKQSATPAIDGGNNYCLVRADLNDFLRLASSDELNIEKHYLLYPNPWPKKQHLHRRWQGSPVFADIIKLGGAIELRSNWKIYAEEFASALQLAGIKSEMRPLKLDDNRFISDFEAKYYVSGHRLWQVCAG